MTEKNVKPVRVDPKTEKSEDISEHMTRAEMVAEVMSMLSNVEDEDFLLVCDQILGVLKKPASS